MNADTHARHDLRTSGHLLDRPVWSALTTRDAAFALGGDRARRFAPDIGPLASARDDEPESLAALAELVPTDGTLLLLQADPIVLPPSLVAVTTAPGVQMALERLVGTHARSDAALGTDGARGDVALGHIALDAGGERSDVRIERLTGADAPAMLELATLTRPGPFAARTPALGEFWGVKDAGRLVAMAGERMKHPGYSEVSGVCTHPDARGRGLARALSIAVATRILARGETPYLHAYATNTPAIALYESLGFRLRTAMHVAVVAHRG